MSCLSIPSAWNPSLVGTRRSRRQSRRTAADSPPPTYRRANVFLNNGQLIIFAFVSSSKQVEAVNEGQAQSDARKTRRWDLPGFLITNSVTSRNKSFLFPHVATEELFIFAIYNSQTYNIQSKDRKKIILTALKETSLSDQGKCLSPAYTNDLSALQTRYRFPFCNNTL